MVDITSLIAELPSASAPLSIRKIMFGLGIFVLFYICLNIISIFLLKAAKRVADRTKTTLDDQIVVALQNPIEYGIILLSLFVFIKYLLPDLTIIGYTSDLAFKILLLVLAAFSSDKLVKAVFIWYTTDSKARANAKLREEILPIISKIISIVIYASVAIIILSNIGIEVGPLLAGLGIAGLAVALALQDSLSNFFAGLYILADRPIKIGDFIKLESGDEGYVQEIGWRSVRVKLLSNNTLIIPNNKLASSTITNRSIPSPQTSVGLAVGVSYDSDPDEVEKALLSAFKAAKKKLPNGKIGEGAPSIRFSEFGDSALAFKMFVPMVDYTVQWEVLHIVRKEVLREFKKHKIQIPSPIRTVYIKKRS